MRRTFLVVALSAATLAACVSTAEHYEAAGFKSAEQARLFVPDYVFYAQQLTPDEWRAFYARFPEYFKDLQDAKTFGSSMEFHPWYTAYAFRWTGDRRRSTWPADTLQRLRAGEVKPGDDTFMVVEAAGPAKRVVVSNWGSVMAYAPSTAYVIRGGVVSGKIDCPACWQQLDFTSAPPPAGMSDDDVVALARTRMR